MLDILDANAGIQLPLHTAKLPDSLLPFACALGPHAQQTQTEAVFAYDDCIADQLHCPGIDWSLFRNPGFVYQLHRHYNKVVDTLSAFTSKDHCTCIQQTHIMIAEGEEHELERVVRTMDDIHQADETNWSPTEGAWQCIACGLAESTLKDNVHASN